MKSRSSRSSLRFLAAALAVALADAAVAQQPAVDLGPWVGKRVITQYGTVLYIDGKPVDDEGRGKNLARGKEHVNHRVYKVKHADGPWVWIEAEQGPAKGWVTPDRLVPYEQAVEFYTNLIRDNPGSAAYYTARGNVWMDREEYDIAVADYNEAIRLEPSESLHYDNRGLAWTSKQEHEKAVSDFNEAIRLDPGWARLYDDRGDVWFAKGDYDKAMADYREAIRLDPTDARYYRDRGRAWLAKKDYDIAIADFNDAIRLDPADEYSYRCRGEAWSFKKDYDKVIADYGEAIRLAPRKPYGYRGRAWAYTRKLEYDKALADRSRAIAVDPSLAFLYDDRGDLWRARREYDKAAADYGEAIRLDPKNAGYYGSRGDAWYSQKEYDKAVTDCNEAIRLDPAATWPRLIKAYSRLAAGREEVVAEARSAIEADAWKGDRSIYGAIVGALGARRVAKDDAAREILDEAGRKADKSQWPYPIVKYLRGEIDDKALMALATDGDKETEARCYLGVDQSIRGRVDEARTNLDWVRGRGTPGYVEIPLAVAELDRLGPVAPAAP